jgi:hypothetical protein
MNKIIAEGYEYCAGYINVSMFPQQKNVNSGEDCSSQENPKSRIQKASTANGDRSEQKKLSSRTKEKSKATVHLFYLEDLIDCIFTIEERRSGKKYLQSKIAHTDRIKIYTVKEMAVFENDDSYHQDTNSKQALEGGFDTISHSQSVLLAKPEKLLSSFYSDSKISGAPIR